MIPLIHPASVRETPELSPASNGAISAKLMVNTQNNYGNRPHQQSNAADTISPSNRTLSACGMNLASSRILLSVALKLHRKIAIPMLLATTTHNKNMCKMLTTRTMRVRMCKRYLMPIMGNQENKKMNLPRKPVQPMGCRPISMTPLLID